MRIIRSRFDTWEGHRSDEYKALKQKRENLMEELDRLNKKLKEINKTFSIKRFKPGDRLYYFFLSKQDNKFELSESVYNGYPNQHKIIRSGCYFISLEEVTQFVDDMEQSLIKIAENRKNVNE